MARICGKCRGSGQFAIQTRKKGLIHVDCRYCSGSGYDNRWGTKSCSGCHARIEYRYDWTNPPKYCESCRKPRYKSCKACYTTIEYKVYWNNVPDHCKTCRDTYYEEWCSIPGCDRKYKYKKTWSKKPDKCKRCQVKEDEGYSHGFCTNCSALTWSPPSKRYNLCYDCNELRKSAKRYTHENNQSENRRFHNAARSMGLSGSVIKNASTDYHNEGSNQERMSYSDIQKWIQSWKDEQS